MKHQSAVVLIALASFSVAAEMRRIRTQNPAGPAEAGPGRIGAPPAPAPDDRPLTVKVWLAIMRGRVESRGPASFVTPGVSVDGLLVETDRGSVILRGDVRTEADKAEAGARAEALAGEGKVVNRLIVSGFPR